MLKRSEIYGLRRERSDLGKVSKGDIQLTSIKYRGDEEMKVNQITLKFLVLTIVLFVVNTAHAELFKKAESAKKHTDFVEGSMLRPRGDVPFNRVWKASKFDKGDNWVDQKWDN